MSEFADFDLIIAKSRCAKKGSKEKYSTTNTSQTESTCHSDMEDFGCEHEHTTNENGIVICSDCSAQLSRELHEKEWKTYRNTRGVDPSRVQPRKVEEKSIREDVKNKGLSDSIISRADDMYAKITNGKIYRGDSSRKAIIFACVRNAYMEEGIEETPENLMRVFGISKKNALKGMKAITFNTADVPVHKGGPAVEQYISDLLDKFSSGNNAEKKREIIDLYHQTRNYSSILKSARPQSYASALVYFWMVQQKIDITPAKFSEKAELSALTIVRNAKEVARILGYAIV